MATAGDQLVVGVEQRESLGEVADRLRQLSARLGDQAKRDPLRRDVARSAPIAEELAAYRLVDRQAGYAELPVAAIGVTHDESAIAKRPLPIAAERIYVRRRILHQETAELQQSAAHERAPVVAQH